MELRELRALRDLEIDLRDQVHRVLVGRSACRGRTLAELAVVLANLDREIHESHDYGDSADEITNVAECIENLPAPAV